MRPSVVSAWKSGASVPMESDIGWCSSRFGACHDRHPIDLPFLRRSSIGLPLRSRFQSAARPDYGAAREARCMQVRVDLLGRFRVAVDGREAAATAWRRTRSAALIKLLA